MSIEILQKNLEDVLRIANNTPISGQFVANTLTFTTIDDIEATAMGYDVCFHSIDLKDNGDDFSDSLLEHNLRQLIISQLLLINTNLILVDQEPGTNSNMYMTFAFKKNDGNQNLLKKLDAEIQRLNRERHIFHDNIVAKIRNQSEPKVICPKCDSYLNIKTIRKHLCPCCEAPLFSPDETSTYASLTSQIQIASTALSAAKTQKRVPMTELAQNIFLSR